MARTSRRRSSSGRRRKVPVDRKVVLVALLFSLAAGLLAALYTVPQLTGLRQARAELGTAEAQIGELQVRLQGAAAGGDAQLEQLYRATQLLEDALPTLPSRELFTVSVVQMAEPIGVQVQRMDPVDDQSAAGRHQFNARFVGTYAALLTFLDRLEGSGQLVTLSSIQLSAQGDLYLLSATLNLWYSPSARLTVASPAVEAPAEADDTARFETPEPDLGATDGDAEDAGDAEDSEGTQGTEGTQNTGGESGSSG
jgi:hypothetical protein